MIGTTHRFIPFILLQSCQLVSSWSSLHASSSLIHHHHSKSVLSATRKRGFGAMARKKQRQSIDDSIYSRPELYDLAFGYRNFEHEMDFLFRCHAEFSLSTSDPQRILEVGAGPARHCLTALTTSDVTQCVAIDANPTMANYSLDLARETLPPEQLHKFHYYVQDMRNFTIPHEGLDTAWLLLGTMQHLTTNSDVISCLQSIAKALKPNGEGTLILELPHPRETFMMMDCTRNGWEVPLTDTDGGDAGELRVVWGDEGDQFDPISQVRDFTVRMELVGVESTGDKSLAVKQIVPTRLFTAQEIDVLARCTGQLELVQMYGALDWDVDVRNDDEAFRLVCVLRTKNQQ